MEIFKITLLRKKVTPWVKRRDTTRTVSSGMKHSRLMAEDAKLTLIFSIENQGMYGLHFSVFHFTFSSGMKGSLK